MKSKDVRFYLYPSQVTSRKRVQLIDISDPDNHRCIGNIHPNPTDPDEHFVPSEALKFSVGRLKTIISIMEMTLEDREDEQKKQDETDKIHAQSSN
jgi:hypothetical protein